MTTEEENALSDIVSLLCEFQWLYDFPVTQVFTRNVLDQMPADWMEVFKDISVEALNGIPVFNTQVHWPTSLKDFLKRCETLSLSHWVTGYGNKYSQVDTLNLELPDIFAKGMSIKKRHETLSLVKLVKKLSDKTNCHCVLDIGSGKGYVDCLLHHFLNLRVLGAESETTRVKNACDRQESLGGSCDGVKHIQWVLRDDKATYSKARDIIFEFVNNNNPCTCGNDLPRGTLPVLEKRPVEQENENTNAKGNTNESSANAKNTIMLLGLHSCADLSPTMIKMFSNFSEISSLVLLSCCYHKMEHKKSCEETEDDASSEETQNTFANFPMSKNLKNIMKKYNFNMSVFGLRLAAQESGVKWSQFTYEDHKNHEKNVVYRGLLEAFCIKENISLKKLKRRCARKSKFTKFEEYVKTVIENYEFIPMKSEILKCPECNMDYTEENLNTSSEKTINNLSMKQNKKSNSCSKCTNMILENKEFPLGSHDFIMKGLHSSHKMYEQTFSFIEPLTGLQLALQPVLETLVLVDRVMYLKECHFDEVWLEKVFDESVSPRNTALVAMKKL